MRATVSFIPSYLKNQGEETSFWHMQLRRRSYYSIWICLYILYIKNIYRNLGARILLTKMCLFEEPLKHSCAASILSTPWDTENADVTSPHCHGAHSLVKETHTTKLGLSWTQAQGTLREGQEGWAARMPELSLESKCPGWGMRSLGDGH